MTDRDVNEAVREGAALFDMSERRGLICVRGEDRVRWLDGMISGDVTALASSEEGAGCYATLLTNRGAIVADLHVGKVGDAFLLETARSELPRVVAALERLIIADDVTLSDERGDRAVVGLEGRAARSILSRALEGDVPASEAWCESRIGGQEVLVGAFGWSGEDAFQIRCDEGCRAAVEAALDAAGGGALPRGRPADLEVLRVEAGVPALGAELDEEVLPPEARLERAIATDKGCYVGQEIVARLRSRGQVNHLLVGLRLDTADGSEVGGEERSLPEVDAELSADGRKTGELTSVVLSPSEGAIALGYVRREHAEPGTSLDFEGGRAQVVALPFVPLGSGVEADSA